MRGLFITFEGIEGSGKTTQIKALEEWLTSCNYSVVLTREPGGTPFANQIRSLLLDAKTHNLEPDLELFLYQIARRDHVSEVIEPALKEGKIILCDRFTDATLAYQGYGRGLPLRPIRTLNRIATGGLKPDATFLFDLPVPTGLKRAQARIQNLRKGTPQEDRFERESLAFHERIRRGYLTLARKEKRRFLIIHAARTPKEVFGELRRKMEKLL